jgi:ribokinase
MARAVSRRLVPRRAAPARRSPVRVVVLGDLMVDVVLAPERPLQTGSDVPGRVSLVQGGSAATTARWLARLGARSTLICSVGRDGAGRALIEAVRRDGVVVHAARVSGRSTGRIGVLVAPSGERSFVADRAAADELRRVDLRAGWFNADALHLPSYSLLGSPLGDAGRAAIELARAAGALVSLDLASIGPLLARGRRAALALVRATASDLLLATESEAEALLGRYALDSLLEFAPIVVVKRGGRGATVLSRGEGVRERLRFDVATTHIDAADTTGAGDAFDAGFLVAWLSDGADGRSAPAALHRAALAGHRAALRQLRGPRLELGLG